MVTYENWSLSRAQTIWDPNSASLAYGNCWNLPHVPISIQTHVITLSSHKNLCWTFQSYLFRILWFASEELLNNKVNWPSFTTVTNSWYWSCACCQIFLCLEWQTNEVKRSVQCRYWPFHLVCMSTTDNCNKRYWIFHVQGSKKTLSGRPGQVDFPFGQVTVSPSLPDRQGPRQAVRWQNFW